MIELAFEQVHLDGARPTSWHEALLGVVAAFSVRRGDAVLWSEVEVPILELAHALHRWLTIEAPTAEAFVYQSMESAEPEWLWFKRTDRGWSLGAGDTRLAEGLTLDDLEDAASRFLNGVFEEVPSAVGVDAKQVVLHP